MWGNPTLFNRAKPIKKILRKDIVITKTWCGNSAHFTLKETRNSYFCVTHKNQRLNEKGKKEKSVTKEVIVCFYNFGEENF